MVKTYFKKNKKKTTIRKNAEESQTHMTFLNVFSTDF